MCIWKHQDYDAACKEESRTDQCLEIAQSRVVECKSTKPNSDEPCSRGEESMNSCTIKGGILGMSCEVNLEVTGLKHDTYA